ncbi:hypothetical protein B0H63DRAFT_132937 [Podospora didyma]|uniref:Uncharacterized protein n=1 Tax=Podospora didyma TaxID=330526 RepID=A0AAE0U540_9PEZI|nr:hypothetical protein B0H63DRAFT_132937 [Podospora didyma]
MYLKQTPSLPTPMVIALWRSTIITVSFVSPSQAHLFGNEVDCPQQSKRWETATLPELSGFLRYSKKWHARRFARRPRQPPPGLNYSLRSNQQLPACLHLPMQLSPPPFHFLSQLSSFISPYLDLTKGGS